jgi:DNA polymerase V
LPHGPAVSRKETQAGNQRKAEQRRHGFLCDPRRRQASFQFPHSTSDTVELIHYACQVLARVFRHGIRYNKCGVMLTELTPDTDQQGDFLDTGDTARSKQLTATLNAIKRRVGRDAVSYAASGVKRDRAMAATMKSQHFTTDWQQLLQVTTR